jgi:hypothetical protein
VHEGLEGEGNRLTGGIVSYYWKRRQKCGFIYLFILGESGCSVNRKEEEKEKSQNHEGDLYLLYCILHFNILFSIL